jgi:hypothetical protein
MCDLRHNEECACFLSTSGIFYQATDIVVGHYRLMKLPLTRKKTKQQCNNKESIIQSMVVFGEMHPPKLWQLTVCDLCIVKNENQMQ